MRRVKWPRMTLLGRIALFLAAFGLAMALEIGIGYYQTKYVLEPLENYRWDYGDTATLLETVQASRQRSASHLARIDTDLRMVSEEQYLLANAARTTYQTLERTLDSIVSELIADRPGQAAQLYYGGAERCGAYLRQYTQQLLERACLDNQDAHIRLVRLNEGLKRWSFCCASSPGPCCWSRWCGCCGRWQPWPRLPRPSAKANSTHPTWTKARMTKPATWPKPSTR